MGTETEGGSRNREWGAETGDGERKQGLGIETGSRQKQEVGTETGSGVANGQPRSKLFSCA